MNTDARTRVPRKARTRPGDKRVRRPSGSRLALAGLVVVGGMFAVADSLASATARSAPATAHQLAPWNGNITNRAAERAFALTPNADGASPASRLARNALRQNATASEAVVVLGLQAQMRNDRPRARMIFTYADTLTRRELQARLWAIEDAAAAGDLNRVLLNYDLALRTSPQAPELLFPILTSALDNALVRQRLVSRLKPAPEWAEPFLHYASRTRSNPRDVAYLIADLKKARVPVTTENSLALVDALAETQANEQAWSLYRTINPAALRDRSRDPMFATGGRPASIFDWTLGKGSSYQQGSKGAVVDFSVPPGSSGTLLQQAQIFPVGRYRLKGLSAAIDQPQGSRPFWSITCTDGRELAQVELSNSPSGEAAFDLTFAVPANCSRQMVALIARATDEIDGITGQVLRAEVTPARSRSAAR